MSLSAVAIAAFPGEELFEVADQAFNVIDPSFKVCDQSV